VYSQTIADFSRPFALTMYFGSQQIKARYEKGGTALTHSEHTAMKEDSKEGRRHYE